MKSLIVALLAAIFLVVNSENSLAQKQRNPVPDLTRGDSIPAAAKHDWNLGATGLRGWMHSHRLETSEARQVAVTKVEEGSPADGHFVKGDVILGVAGQRFSSDPRTEIGKALTAAESPSGRGKLSLIRWRKGEVKSIQLKLAVLGNYGSEAPYGCTKSRRILKAGCKALAERMESKSYKPRTIPRCLNALALLASGDAAHLPLVRREVEWATQFRANSFATWYYGYTISLMAEYAIATRDRSVLPSLRRVVTEATEGQSAVGSWGHKFAGPEGRLVGYGMMNAPGVPLTSALVLARKAGVKGEDVDRAIDRSVKLLRFYAGKGAVPYGDHKPWIQTHEDNGKCGMAAVLFNLIGDKPEAEFFSRMSVASHGAERDTGHTGNFMNLLWALPAVALAGPKATGAWMSEYGAWYFDLARQVDGTFAHQGPPEEKNDKYRGWDATGAYLLAYALPLRKLMLTGRENSLVDQVDSAEAQSLIRDGRGWSNDHRNEYYDGLSQKELLARLGSWSPVVRERAAIALGRSKKNVSAQLISMLNSSDLNERYGACQALALGRGQSKPAVPALIKSLKHNDRWLRIKAAEALAAIGKPAMKAAPVLLEMLAKPPTQEDPRGMEQRYLCVALFDRRRGLLKRSAKSVDREALFTAVRAGLLNEDGHARSSLGSVYAQLSFEELRPLLPSIHAAVVESAPSGIMFADGIRVAGLKLLAKHHVKEGIAACASYVRNQKKHGSQKRVPQILELLASYGAHAKAVIPDLEETAKYFETSEEGFPKKLSLRKAGFVRDMIRTIQASESYPELTQID